MSKLWCGNDNQKKGRGIIIPIPPDTKKGRKEEMRKFIIREDTIKKVQKALKNNKEVLHDFDTGLCTLSLYMPCHADIGDEECCGIFMGIDNKNSVVCNECGMNINDALKQLKEQRDE